MSVWNFLMRERRENGIYWKDQKDDLDGVTIPTPYLQQFLHDFSVERIIICILVETI